MHVKLPPFNHFQSKIKYKFVLYEQRCNLQKPKTVLWEGKNSILTPKKVFVKNNESEGANCIAANLSFKKKVLLSLKKHIWGEKSIFARRARITSAKHEVLSARV